MHAQTAQLGFAADAKKRRRVTARKFKDVDEEMWVVYLLEERVDLNDYWVAKGWGNNPDADTGVVYFIQAEDGPVKIGYTGRPIKQRLQALQSTNARRLRVLATFAANREVEHMLHVQFKRGRIHGEWFKPNTRGLQNVIKWAAEGGTA